LNQESLHILFIISQPLFPLQGASFTCYRQATAFNKRGFRITILAPRSKKDQDFSTATELADQNRIRILNWLPSKEGRKIVGHLNVLIFSGYFILKAIREEKPDILHVHNPPDIIPMIVSLINRFFKIPYVLQVNDPGPESILSLRGLGAVKRKIMLMTASLMENIILKHASALITINEALKAQMIATRKAISAKPFKTQYHVPSLPKSAADQNAESNENYVFYVGTLSTELLGLEELIQLYLPVWHRHGIRLYIAGDGPLRPKLEQVIQSAQAGEYVKLLGYVRPQDIHGFIKKSKLCVIPYLDTVLTRVSTPTKLFEYISFGKAVVCPNFLGFTEILGDDYPGLFRTDVSGDMIRVINNLLSNTTVRDEIETRNKTLSLNYTFDKEMVKTLSLYREVCLKSSP
jgi:glycosyltransferase involved in cell wall biosynthesis